MARNLVSQPISAGEWHVLGRAERAACKTVGFAYVGSNPTPATSCENGPLAAYSRAGGAFFSVPSCVTLSRCGPSCCAVHGRIADGRPCGWAARSGQLRRSVCAVATVGAHRRRFHGRPRTGRAGGVSRLDARRRVRGHRRGRYRQVEVTDQAGPGTPGGRHLRLRLATRWPWADEIRAAFTRLQALPSGWPAGTVISTGQGAARGRRTHACGVTAASPPRRAPENHRQPNHSDQHHQQAKDIEANG